MLSELNSKRTKEMNEKAEGKLFKFVETNPGLSVKELADKLLWSKSTVRKHLNMLCAKLRVKRVGRFRKRYYARSFNPVVAPEPWPDPPDPNAEVKSEVKE